MHYQRVRPYAGNLRAEQEIRSKVQLQELQLITTFCANSVGTKSCNWHTISDIAISDWSPMTQSAGYPTIPQNHKNLLSF